MVNPVDNVVWAPQPGPQEAFIRCDVYEIFYGGARGGAKTDSVLGKYGIKQERYGSGFNGVIFRKTVPSQDDLVSRSREIYGPLGGKYNETKSTWKFPRGGKLRFRPLETVQDADKYQGQNLSDVAVEEAGVYADPAPIQRLHGILRSAHGVPTQLVLTGNPGGAGQAWLDERYVKPFPAGFKIHYEEYETLPGVPPVKRGRVFIPSKVTDNKILLQNDPGYVVGLRMVGGEDLVNAWLFGRWDGKFGQFFNEWKPEKHVIPDFPIPLWWKRYGAMDWGYDPDPWVYKWYAVDDQGHTFLYREIWGNEMTPREAAEKILSAQGDERVSSAEGDPNMFFNKDGVSTGEKLNGAGLPIFPANNEREQGWMRVREVLRDNPKTGLPYFRVLKSCQKSVEAIPAMRYHEKNRLDCAPNKLDHWTDCDRYHFISRFSESSKPKEPPPWDSYEGMKLRQIRREYGR